MVRQRSAKPLSPGSNPGVAFINLSTFPAPTAASSPKSRNSTLCQTSSNQVESPQEFSPNLVQVFASVWGVTANDAKTVFFSIGVNLG